MSKSSRTLDEIEALLRDAGYAKPTVVESLEALIADHESLRDDWASRAGRPIPLSED